MADEKICVCPQCGKKYKLKKGFEAASFSCKACGATVWVEGKPKVVVSKRKSAGARKPRAGARRAGARKPRGAAPVRGRRREQSEEDEERPARGRYSKQSSNTNVILAIVGLVVVVGLVIGGIAMMGGKDKPAKVATGPGASTEPATQPPVQPAPVQPATPEVPPIPVAPAPTGTDPTPEPDKATDAVTEQEATTEGPARKLGGTKQNERGIRVSKWDPPTDIPHLEDTAADMREKIDKFVVLVCDPDAGRDSLDAKEALIAIGKPAFPRLLGAMAQLREKITDNDNIEERLLRSSLKLCDEALREMDGWLTAKGKSTLRPGSEKRYVQYICRLHYKRWLTKLKDMPEMPGPFDPTGEYEGEAEEYDGGRG